MTNDAAPLRSSLGSLSPPRRLRLVVPWFSCWVMSDGEDGSAELQLQMTREVSACTKKLLLLLTYTVAVIIINNKTTKNKLIASEEHVEKICIIFFACNSCFKIAMWTFSASYLNIKIFIITGGEVPSELQDGVSTVLLSSD